MPSGHDYEALLATTAQILFDTSVLTASEISEAWPARTEGQVLSNEQTWSLQTELIWFLVSAICTEVVLLTRAGVHERDNIHDDLVSCVIQHMLDRMFDWSHEPSARRTQQAEIFLNWHNQTEMSFGTVTEVFPPMDHFTLEDNLVGRAAMRMATTNGQQHNTGLIIDLSLVHMGAHIAAKVHKLTVSLVQALQAQPTSGHEEHPRTGLFGKSVDARYAELAASLAPIGRGTEYPDPVTQAVLQTATDAAVNHYASIFASAENLSVARKLWENEIFRLVGDGYLLGRVEEGTERQHLRFSDLADDLPLETGEFVVLSGSFIRGGLEQGHFAKRPPSDIQRLMEQFSKDALKALFDVLATDDNCRPLDVAFFDSNKPLGVSLFRAVNLGRQTALVEGLYLNRKKRRQHQEIRAQVEREELQRVRQILKDAGVKTPQEAAELILARTRDFFRGLG